MTVFDKYSNCPKVWSAPFLLSNLTDGEPAVVVLSLNPDTWELSPGDHEFEARLTYMKSAQY